LGHFFHCSRILAMGIAEAAIFPGIVAVDRGEQNRQRFFGAGLFNEEAQVLFVTSDSYVTLVFLYCRVVVTELDQHQIIWLQRAIDFIPAALFEEGAGAAAAFGFVNYFS